MAKPQQPHVVVVPHPSLGHVNPALQLAQALHRHGIFITFVITEHNHRSAAGGVVASSHRDGSSSFRVETIPDGLLDGNSGGNAVDRDRALSKATTGERGAAQLRELLARLRDDGVPPVTCLLPTALMSFVIDVARELGVPSMVLWVCPAASLLCQMRLCELRERGYLPLKASATCHFVRTTDPDDFSLWFNDTEANNLTKAGALILNTFDALDPAGLAALRAEFPRVFTVGPLGLLLRRCLDVVDDSSSSTSSSISAAGDTLAGGELMTSMSPWKHDTACIAWLDTQQPGTVVYANFGSLVVLTADQLAEFAWGLAATGRPFLLVVREDLVVSVSGAGDGGGATSLPPDFLSATAAEGRSSTMEALAVGMPVVCWPAFADGYTICKYACEVWGVGLRLDAEVRREQVAELGGTVMESVGIRACAARWKNEAEKAVCPGGSSWDSLLDMVKALEVGSPSLDC
ncbi:hypothetical protein HU200_005006 [Digitaria exilis]|uniref:Glycosyltransferase n=1 Tax=Digitaria exilis TaxID=1010633 RepID=A0A835FSH6_9POAL|nr:hypothetical protein HU200_005006 [Digitaria exilis]